MVIHKYLLSNLPEQVVLISGLVEVLSVAVQNDNLVMYALRKSNTRTTTTHVQVLIQMTGQDFYPTSLSPFTFQGTFLTQNDTFVLHVWTRKGVYKA